MHEAQDFRVLDGTGGKSTFFDNSNTYVYVCVKYSCSGVAATVQGRDVSLGNLNLVRHADRSDLVLQKLQEWEDIGCTCVFVCVDCELKMVCFYVCLFFDLYLVGW